MTFLLRTLSLSYVRRHRLQTLLTLIGVVVGVATFSAVRSAQGALVRGVRDTVDRMAGKAHLQVYATRVSRSRCRSGCVSSRPSVHRRR